MDSVDKFEMFCRSREILKYGAYPIYLYRDCLYYWYMSSGGCGSTIEDLTT